MTQNIEDLRVRRTRKSIQEAYLYLVVEKGYADVTVSDITERAMVNRSTFYRHFLDKCDLVEQFMKEATALTYEDDAEMDNKQEWKLDEGAPGLIKLLKHIQQYSDFYRVMFGVNGDPMFVRDFRQRIEKRFRHLQHYKTVTLDKSSAPFDMRLNYISYANIGAILWWLDNGQPCSVEQLAIWLGQLSSTSAGFLLTPP